MEEVKSRGPYIYSVLESAQAFLSQHPFEELEEPTSESKGLWNPLFLVLPQHSSPGAGPERMEWRWLVWHKVAHQCSALSHDTPVCFQCFWPKVRAVLLSRVKAEAAGTAHDGVHLVRQDQMCSGVGF